LAVHYQASARCFFSIGGAARDGVFRHHQDEQLGRMARGRRLDGVAFHGEQGAVVGRQDQRSCLRRARWLSPPPLSQALFSSVGRSAFMASRTNVVGRQDQRPSWCVFVSLDTLLPLAGPAVRRCGLTGDGQAIQAIHRRRTDALTSRTSSCLRPASCAPSGRANAGGGTRARVCSSSIWTYGGRHLPLRPVP
jgi:hypothetical protein